MDAFVESLIERAKQTPYFHLQGYMERYWLTDSNKTSFGTMAQRVHRILREDRDAVMHDHPCENVSVILDGWYRERVPADQSQHPSMDATHWRERTFLAGEVIHRQAHHRHKIVDVSVGGVWTLWTIGHRERDWGFWTPDGWVYWREYLNQWGADPAPGELAVAR